MSALGSVSSAVEDYAKAIYALEERGGAGVSTNALAERLGVTAASASGMVKRLGELGLVTHTPYHGVRLTEPGIRPGDPFTVEERQPFGGPLFVRFGEDLHVLGGALARAMRVEAL